VPLDTPTRQKRQKQLDQDTIMRQAADVVLSEVRAMKDVQMKDECRKQIPVSELPQYVNLQEVARGFRAQLEEINSTEDALAQRLQKWRIRGVDDDPVTLRGRPAHKCSVSFELSNSCIGGGPGPGEIGAPQHTSCLGCCNGPHGQA
jgi:hypothetical protein